MEKEALGFETIQLGHGSGGLMTRDLLDKIIFKSFSNPYLDQKHDGAIINIKGSDIKSYQLITTAYQDTRKELQESKNIVAGLHSQIDQLNSIISDLHNRIEQGAIENNNKVIAFSRIAKEAKIRYNGIVQIGFSN